MKSEGRFFTSENRGFFFTARDARVAQGAIWVFALSSHGRYFTTEAHRGRRGFFEGGPGKYLENLLEKQGIYGKPKRQKG